MMKPIIRVENLSKQYRIGTTQKRHDTLRDVITGVIRSPLSRLQSNGHNEADTIWALREVNFEVMPGEVIGIIGSNGAGKSTLLKILSRITEPTKGTVDLYGRVASLLEVGTGFHGELSGRENIFLNGAILGMRRAEIQRKFDEIVAFAEIEKFIDTPVKHYSSGMYMRLAFAVAAHLEPEILIVDEVLAVGDASFQKKCLGKMGEVSKAGRTVLFVSHNVTAMQALCTRAIVLELGEIIADCGIHEAVSLYLWGDNKASSECLWEDPDKAPGNELVRVRLARVTADSSHSHRIDVSTPVKLEFEFWNFMYDVELNFSVVLYNREGICVFNTVSESKRFSSGLVKGVCHIPSNLLNASSYRVRLLIVKDRSSALIDINDLVRFEVCDVPREGNWYGEWVGVVRPILDWSISDGVSG